VRRGHLKAKAHIYVIYMNFWEIIIAFPNGGQWAPFSKVCPSWLKSLVTPLVGGRSYFRSSLRALFLLIGLVLPFYDKQNESHAFHAPHEKRCNSEVPVVANVFNANSISETSLVEMLQ